MSHASGNVLKSILFALGANLAIAAAKTAGAVATGSSSLLAEAIHSFADCGNQALLILGLREARREPTADHPLGHGRAVFFWSFIVALMLFSLGGVFSIYEGWHKLHGAEPVRHALVAIAILGFGVVAEGISLWGCLREIAKERAGRSLWRWFRESRSSELLVVLGEDLAALGGLVFALLAITLSVITGDPRWDAAGSIVIGGLLVVVAMFIAIEIKALLVGRSADPEVVRALHTHLQAQPEIAQVYNVLTQQLGGEVMLSVKARLHPQGNETSLIEAINRIERGLRERFPALRWVFFEPDLRD